MHSLLHFTYCSLQELYKAQHKVTMFSKSFYKNSENDPQEIILP